LVDLSLRLGDIDHFTRFLSTRGVGGVKLSASLLLNSGTARPIFSSGCITLLDVDLFVVISRLPLVEWLRRGEEDRHQFRG
jgi:hypothetical protein